MGTTISSFGGGTGFFAKGVGAGTGVGIGVGTRDGVFGIDGGGAGMLGGGSR